MPLRAIEPDVEAARPRSDSRFRSQPCRRAFRPTIHGGSMCWNGSGLAHAVSFDIDWDLLPYAPVAGYCCRSSARPMGRRWKRARSNFATTPTKAVFSGMVFEHRLRSHPSATARILRSLVKEAGAEADTAGKRILDLASRAKGCVIQSQGSAAFKAELKSIAAVPTSSPADSTPTRRTGSPCPGPGAASSAGTPALQLGHCDWRPATSTIGALRRQCAGRIGVSRIPARSTPSIAWSKADRGNGLTGLAARPPSTACASAQYFQRLRRLIGKRREKTPGRSTW